MNRNEYFDQIAKESPEKVKCCSVCHNEVILFDRFVEEYKSKDLICSDCINYCGNLNLMKAFLEENNLGSLFNKFHMKHLTERGTNERY